MSSCNNEVKLLKEFIETLQRQNRAKNLQCLTLFKNIQQLTKENYQLSTSNKNLYHQNQTLLQKTNQLLTLPKHNPTKQSNTISLQTDIQDDIQTQQKQEIIKYIQQQNNKINHYQTINNDSQIQIAQLKQYLKKIENQNGQIKYQIQNKSLQIQELTQKEQNYRIIINELRKNYSQKCSTQNNIKLILKEKQQNIQNLKNYITSLQQSRQQSLAKSKIQYYKQLNSTNTQMNLINLISQNNQLVQRLSLLQKQKNVYYREAKRKMDGYRSQNQGLREHNYNIPSNKINNYKQNVYNLSPKYLLQRNFIFDQHSSKPSKLKERIQKIRIDNEKLKNQLIID